MLFFMILRISRQAQLNGNNMATERLRDKSYQPSQHTPKKIGKMTVHHAHATLPFKITMLFVLSAFIYGLYWYLTLPQ